jgi:glycolate oxidase iron-sulfur subunit
VTTGPSADDQALLHAVEEAIAVCNRCGSCQAVCPVYAETHTEPGVARGKVQLAAGILGGELPVDGATAEAFTTCTTCMACEEACPSGVPVVAIVDAARAQVVEERGLPWVKRAIFGGVRRPGVLRAAADAAARLQGAAFKKTAGSDLRRLRFPYGLAARRAYPPLAARPFELAPAWGVHPGRQRSRPDGPRVLLFPGCMVTYVYPGIGHAAVQVLERAGASVATPPEAACCGVPLEAHGDVAGAKDLARLQLDQLEGIEFDALVAACPTCTSSFVHRYPRLLAGEPRYAARAQRLAARSYDITSYLVDVLHVIPPAGSLDAAVTYHDPCHLVRGLGVSRQPRELLTGITGVRLQEMREPARCCGGAGSFSLTHQELSIAIGARKAADIAQTGAEVVATACPGCRMQLADVLAQAGDDRPVAHVVELLAAAGERGS